MSTRVSRLVRKVRWARQRVTRGYSDLDSWNLNSFLSEVIASVTKDMRENGHGYPYSLTVDEWNQILTKIEAGFRAASQLYELDYTTADEAAALEATFREGMDLFSKWFHALWD